MSTYEERPEIIEAMRLTEVDLDAFAEFVGETVTRDLTSNLKGRLLCQILTPEGRLLQLETGDWAVKVGFDFIGMNDEEFCRKYRPARENA